MVKQKYLMDYKTDTMHKSLLILFILLSFLIVCKSQDSLMLVSHADSLRASFQRLSRDLKDKQDSLNVEIRRIDSLYKKIETDTSLKKVNEKLKYISDKVEIIEKQEAEKIKVKFKICGKAIDELERGAVFIGFVNDLLQLQEEIHLTTNIWKDSVIRNGFDKAQSWVTIAGSAFAGISLLGDQAPDKKLQGAGIGVSIVGLGTLLKKSFGKENIKHFELIQLSRKSYDDLVQLNNLLNSFINENKSFDSSLGILKTKFVELNKKEKDGKIENEEFKFFIIEVIDAISNYSLLLKQIPSYLAQLKGLMATYSLKYYGNEELNTVLSRINEKVREVGNSYSNRVKPLLDIGPDVKSVLLSN